MLRADKMLCDRKKEDHCVV